MSGSGGRMDMRAEGIRRRKKGEKVGVLDRRNRDRGVGVLPRSVLLKAKVDRQKSKKQTTPVAPRTRKKVESTTASKTLKGIVAPSLEWAKILKKVSKTRKEAKYRSKLSRRRKIIRSIADMEYVPDPLTKKPADYYITQPTLPWELRFNPFSLLFHEGSVPISRIPDLLFYGLNFLQAPILSLFCFAGVTAYGWSKSLESLGPDTPSDYPPFDTDIQPILDRYDFGGTGLAMVLVCALLCAVVVLGCSAVYQGRSRILVIYAGGVVLVLCFEWYFAFKYVNRSPCRQLDGLRGTIQHHLEQFWAHDHTHNRFGPHVVINNLQRYLGCCGNKGPLDYLDLARNERKIRYPLPQSCCSVLWFRNPFCANVAPLHASNPDFANKINQKGCFESVIKVCHLIMFVLTSWLRWGAMAHTVLVLCILASVLSELSMLKTMVLSCHKIEFALRSYIIPDEPLIRKQVHGFTGIDEDMGSSSGLTLETAYLPREMQRRIDKVRERQEIGKEKYGLDIDEIIRAELKIEADKFVKEAVEAQELERGRGKPKAVDPAEMALTQNRAFFASGRYKFLLPLNKDTQKLLPRVLQDNKNYNKILVANTLRMADLENATSGPDPLDLLNPDVDDEVILEYEKKRTEAQGREKKVGKLNKWVWRPRKHNSPISIPSDDQVPMSKAEIERARRKRGGAVPKRKKKHHTIFDPEESFRQETEAQIEQIKEEMKLLANEPSKTRRVFLEHVALQQIEQLKNEEVPGGRKIVILEDHLLSSGTKPRRQSFDVSKITTSPFIPRPPTVPARAKPKEDEDAESTTQQ